MINKKVINKIKNNFLKKKLADLMRKVFKQIN